MSSLAGTDVLLRFGVRRDRVRLLVWVLALGVTAVYTVVALDRVYPTAADRAARAAVAGAPAGIMFTGPGFGTDDYTLGAMTANELGLSLMLPLGIMSILLVVRHTRTAEENGQAELLLAGAVGRQARLTTAVALMLLADLAVAALIAAGLSGTGLEPADTLAFAAGLGLTGAVFGAVAAVTAQLFEHARAASAAGLAVLAVAAVVRGIGDMLETGGSPLSWFSPIAWAQQTRPYVELRWWPLLLSVVLVVLLVGAAYALNGRRDLGAGSVAPRRGPASGSLAGVGQLLVRLQRGTALGWGVALLVLGVTFGSLTREAAGMLAGNPLMAQVFGGGAGSFTDAFLSVSVRYMAFGTTAFAVVSVLRLRAEEAAGRTELLLAHPVDRRRLLGAGLLVTGSAAVLLLVLGGLGTGVAAAAALGDASLIGSGLGAAVAQLPAVLVVAGVAALLVGALPRLAALSWLVVVWALLAGMFGPLLGLPGWALKFSPFGWVPQVPAESVPIGPLAGLVAVAVVLGAGALAAFRRRDVPA